MRPRSATRTGILPSLLFALLAATLGPGSARGAGGGSVPSPTVARTPEEAAAEHYNLAIRYREKAQELEAQAAGTAGPERDKLRGKAEKAYQKAIAQLEEAVAKNPRLHAAWSDLGYARRKTGSYEGSLAAYDRALTLAPGYSPAIEYRAEAYLGLGRLDEAKQAYLALFTRDRPRADQLLQAMRSWLDGRQQQPAGLAPEALADFESWLAEREQIASQTADLYGGARRVW